MHYQFTPTIRAVTPNNVDINQIIPNQNKFALNQYIPFVNIYTVKAILRRMKVNENLSSEILEHFISYLCDGNHIRSGVTIITCIQSKSDGSEAKILLKGSYYYILVIKYKNI